MTGGRCSQWSQGDILLCEGDLGVLISHDCDLCAEYEVEPNFEWIPFEALTKMDGQRTYGKNPRVLHLEAKNEAGDSVPLSLDARAKRVVDKKVLYERIERAPLGLGLPQLHVLRRWLSARYSRSAFPNAFEDLMRKIDMRVDSLAKKSGAGIRGLYFDLDDGEMIERIATESTYQLHVYVVYPPETDDEVAANFGRDLKIIFEKAFCSDGVWSGISLISCDAICEDSFPLLLANSCKPWRVDHRSLSGTPAAALMPNIEC